MELEPSVKKKRKVHGRVYKFFKANSVGWAFNLPLFIGLLVFTFIPMVLSFYYSFFSIDASFAGTFVGFKNYIRIFTKDPDISKAVLNTVIYAVISVPLNLVLSYFLALLVNSKFKFTGFYRILYYLPVVIPGVVSGLLWKDLTDQTYGVFNKILTSIGLSKFTFFSDAKTALISLVFMNTWGIGGGMVLWLSAFKSIPKTLYESARMEGANAFQRFKNITLPLSTPMIFYNMVMSIIGTLQFNGTMTIVGRGGRGPEDSLLFYGVKVYLEAFSKGNIGYGAALSWVLFVVIAILTGVLFLTSKWVYYGEDQ